MAKCKLFVGISAASLLLPAFAGGTATAATAVGPSAAVTPASCGVEQVGSNYITYSGMNYGSIFLEYNSCNRTIYALGYTYETCTADNNCVFASVNRSDGAREQCESGHDGNPQEYCDSASLSDAGYTSNAVGTVFDGPISANGATGSF